MKIIDVHNLSVGDQCLAMRYVPGSANSHRTSRLKLIIKKWIYQLLSGRPRGNQPRIPEHPKCVLVATGGNLGGAIISLPLIHGVRKRWPDTHLAVVSNRRHGLEIVKRAGVGDSFHLAPEVSLKQTFLSFKNWKFRQELRRMTPEVYVSNFDFGLDHTLPIRGISLTIGNGLGKLLDHDVHCQDIMFDMSCPFDPRLNWLANYWNLLEMLGVTERERPTITVSENERLAALKSIKELGGYVDRPLIGIQSSVWEKEQFKSWPLTHMAALCEGLWKHHLQPLVIGSEGQDELVHYLRRKHPGASFIDGVGKFSIGQLPKVIACCAAVVTNDSGLMHVSAAVGTPTLAIYGMTNPDITWVYGPKGNHRIVRAAGFTHCYDLDPGLARKCLTKSCLKSISPDMVLNELLIFIRPLEPNERTHSKEL